MIAPVAQQWEGPKPHGLGPSPIVCCPSAHPCCAGDARGSGSRAGAVSIGGVHPTPRPLPESVTDALHACSTRSAREALHPLRRNAPDQKGCNAYGSGAPPPTTSTNASIPFRHTQPTASDAATRPRHAHPGSEREALHQLGSVTPPRAGVTPLSNMPNRGHSLPTHHNRQHRTQPHDLEIIAPIPRKSRCTRYVALHPLRRDAPEQKGCNAYGSGAPPPTTSTTADISSRHTQATASDAATQPRNTRPAPYKRRYTRSVALHPLRHDAPDQKRCNAYRSGAPPLSNKPN